VEDEEEDEMTSLLEDISQEVLDFEAEKEKKKADKESTEAALVAGGASLHDKAATMVLNGEKVRIGGPAVDLTTVGCASPTISLFGSSLTDGSVTSASTSTSDKKRNRDDKVLASMLELEAKKSKEELDHREALLNAKIQAQFAMQKVDMEMRQQELKVKIDGMQATREQNSIMLTSLQLQMKQFELKMAKQQNYYGQLQLDGGNYQNYNFNPDGNYQNYNLNPDGN
jgi:hypothetical protein